MTAARNQPSSEAQLKAIDHKLGVDRPILLQYKDFVWRLVRHGSFGDSWRFGTPIDPQLHRTIGVTGSIVLGGAALLFLLAIPLGIVSALRANTFVDRAILFGSIFGIALHPLVVRYLLRQGFGVSLDFLPSARYCASAGRRIVVLNLIADSVQAAMDPRVRQAA